MPAPENTTAHSINVPVNERSGKPLTAVELLDPVPVSKWNLYVLIGCTALVVLLILLGPWLYPYVADFTENAWSQFK
ncbi:putative membrane protein [Corynebacterium deserti GIMN1.010]|uniref:Putative membrane protein n=1 Tax=Corynebacterium deserti GIMN1.010 TaxID=931089 RepID=A0A0M5IM84_9CORY|nr:hypothetical protein [Corynebacterium deserti]ALC06398.1 putative membrane protein [Corynebacterium deserti GIMN1.010]